MRLAGGIFCVVFGLVAALCISGCHTELEPYTPAGADALWQPEPVPDLFGDAATVVTDVSFESQVDAAVVVVRTSGAPPQIRAHQRHEPTHVALDIQATRLGTEQSVFALQDPGGTVTKVVAVERIRDMQPQVIIRVHLHEAVPFEVEQDQGVIRLALARRQPDAGAAESPTPAPEADAEPALPERVMELPEAEAISEPEPPPSEPVDAPDEPMSSETAAEPPASETGTESATDEITAEPAPPEAVVELPETEAAPEPPSEHDDPSLVPSSASIFDHGIEMMQLDPFRQFGPFFFTQTDHIELLHNHPSQLWPAAYWEATYHACALR